MEEITRHQTAAPKALLIRIEQLLAQPEQKPMTAQEISQGFRADKDATNAESYWAGVALAEKHHGAKKK
jgi:hypothetical protein